MQQKLLSTVPIRQVGRCCVSTCLLHTWQSTYIHACTGHLITRWIYYGFGVIGQTIIYYELSTAMLLRGVGHGIYMRSGLSFLMRYLQKHTHRRKWANFVVYLLLAMENCQFARCIQQIKTTEYPLKHMQFMHVHAVSVFVCVLISLWRQIQFLHWFHVEGNKKKGKFATVY